MTTPTAFTHRCGRHAHYLLALSLLCLTVSSVCWAQQTPTGAPRRTPRNTRLQTIQLPEAVASGNLAFETALIQKQKVTAPPSDQRLRFSEIGQLAWAAQGVRTPQSSAGAAAPTDPATLKVYFVLPDGFYVYDPSMHSLKQEGSRDERQAVVMALLNRPGPPLGGAQIVLAGSSRDFATRYGTYAKTAMLLQAGQAAQNIQLQAVSLGLTFVSVEGVNMAGIRRAIQLPKNLEPVYAILVGYPADKVPAAAGEQAVAAQPADKKVLLVVPPRAFQDQELTETRRAIELAGIPVVVASTRLGPIAGMLGSSARADVLINQALDNISGYSAVVFIGGTGAVDYFSNPVALNLARQAVAQRKVLAAIGTAPTILANAGVLRGARVTGYLPEQARLVQGGALYTGNPVEKDDLIVTATSAPAAPLFVQAILEGIAETR